MAAIAPKGWSFSSVEGELSIGRIRANTRSKTSGNSKGRAVDKCEETIPQDPTRRHSET
jgi:hypothetical protein